TANTSNEQMTRIKLSSDDRRAAGWELSRLSSADRRYDYQMSFVPMPLLELPLDFECGLSDVNLSQTFFSGIKTGLILIHLPWGTLPGGSTPPACVRRKQRSML